MAEYHVKWDVTAFGSVKIEAESKEEALEKFDALHIEDIFNLRQGAELKRQLSGLLHLNNEGIYDGEDT